MANNEPPTTAEQSGTTNMTAQPLSVTATLTSVEGNDGYSIEIEPNSAAMLSEGDTFAIAMYDEQGNQIIQQIRTDANGKLHIVQDPKQQLQMVEKNGELQVVDTSIQATSQESQSTSKSETQSQDSQSSHQIQDGHYQCGMCERILPTKKEFDAHLFAHTMTCTHVNNVKTYVCGLCEKTFSSDKVLQVHMRIHTEERPFQCEFCPKAFKQKGGLVSHSRKHTGERPHVCDICHTGYIDKGSLKKHKRIHTGEKPYPCDLCPKAFSSSGLMQAHRRVHTGEKPYACRICPKTFAEAGGRNKHEKIHAGEKPHKCPVCDKAFLQSSHVVRHLRIHTGEKPFVCRSCPKAYGHSESLLKHNRQHHNIEAKHVSDVMQGGTNVQQLMDATHYEVLHVAEVLKDAQNQEIVIVSENGEQNFVVVPEGANVVQGAALPEGTTAAPVPVSISQA